MAFENNVLNPRTNSCSLFPTDQLATEAARGTILKYNELFTLGFLESDVNSLLQKNNKRGYVEVDDIIDGLEELEDAK